MFGHPVVDMLAEQINDGIAKINAANEILLADEGATGVREIDKALKEGTENESVNSAWAEAESLRESYRNALENARNLYRTEVLGEDAQEATDDVDKDEVRTIRKMVMESINLTQTFAESNNLTEVTKWIASLEVPQVGRNASSSVGQRKVRAFVHVDDSTFDTFGDAAKFISAEDDVKVTPADLTNAYLALGTEDEAEFEFNGRTVRVVPKAKKND